MLTRPAEIDSERKKVSNEPILLIEFPNLGVRYATQDYTWDNGGTLETFTGKLAKRSVPSFTISIPELIGGVASIGRISLKITDWQGSTRSELFGTSGDITNEPVSVYLKFKTSSNLKTDALLLFTGRVERWKVVKDTVSLDIKPDIDGLKNKLLTKHAESGKYYPIQYGDMFWTDTYFMHDGEGTPYYAEIIPAIALKENGKTTYLICNHDYYSRGSDLFYIRDKQYVRLGGISPSFTSSAPYEVTLFLTSSAYGMMTRWPTRQGSNNRALDWQKAVDGKSTTSVLVFDDGSSDLAVIDAKFSTVSEAQVKSGGVGGVYFQAVIEFGAIDANGFGVQISDGISTVNHAIYTSYANTTQRFDFHSGIIDFEAADNCEIWIYYGGTSGNLGNAVEIKNIKVLAYVEPPGQDESLYLPMKGKTFQTDWGGRKTVGALITTAAEVIEDLFREAGFTEFRTSLFDAVHNDLNALNIKAKMTIKEDKTVRELVDDVAKGHFLAVVWSQSGWGLLHRYPSRLAFSYSGDTASPRNEDIFSQTPAFDWKTGVYSENPLMQMNLTRTKKPVDRVVFKYAIAAGEYLREVTAGASTGDTEEVELFGIGDATSANNLANEVKNLYLIQRAVVTFEAFWNSIIFEPGDVINVRHPNLSDSILQGTVNNTKWQIIEFKPKFRPNKIQIKAIEVA